MSSSQSNAEERRVFEERVRAMSVEELQALATILERRSTEMHEELHFVTQLLTTKRRHNSHLKSEGQA